MPSFNPDSIWEAKPHTLAKIEIIRRYLFLWYSILGNNPLNKNLLYIDGFAGPGQYSNSDQSSPLAAMQAAKAAFEHPNSKLQNTKFTFLFVEKRKDFAGNLNSVISAVKWPENFTWKIEIGSFEEKVGGILSDLEKQRKQLVPTFAFIDPFGATGLPFDVVSKILNYRSCEVLLNLDSDGIGRLLTAQRFEKNQENLNVLFGDSSWRDLNPTLPMAKLSSAVLDLYKQKLRQDVKYVFPFAMNTSQGQLNYHLVFASQYYLGLEKMKEAMKAVDKEGTYSFSDDSVGQELLKFDFSSPEEWALKMRNAICGKWLPYDVYRDYALNETPFVNPKSMFECLRKMGKIHINWIGESSKHGFPEEKIRSILLMK